MQQRYKEEIPKEPIKTLVRMLTFAKIKKYNKIYLKNKNIKNDQCKTRKILKKYKKIVK